MEDKSEPLLTSAQVAERFGVTRRTISAWVRDGRLRPSIVTMGGQYRFRWSEVEQQMREAEERDDG
ncbi:helix-turn-helix domain-containing protein [Pseudonocardia humida]|uniref:Helix-turn-helix domain-containing protein n=1 Tax=Pseudonocardia humida TaxID=2800819 RepID=A0ABT1A5Q1_9PSEU|nr:helix-turn-helix domain-containing protein [Pseudonocardia humida]MCO1658351.1 helix-turn-helix domain-containing protein [Pseudonocardia humida]